MHTVLYLNTDFNYSLCIKKAVGYKSSAVIKTGRRNGLLGAHSDITILH